jgi:hypothetical protein
MVHKRILPIVILAMISVLFIGLVGARGSIGFSRGSVNAFGEITGKYDKNGDVTLTVEQHPDASGLELYAICQNKGGNIAPGVNPVTAQISMSDSASISGLQKSKGKVTIQEGDLVADLGKGELKSLFDSSEVCPNGNWDVIDAYPVGFVATVDVNSKKGTTGQRFQYTCGTTLASGQSPFVDGDSFNGSEYSCVETLDVNNP